MTDDVAPDLAAEPEALEDAEPAGLDTEEAKSPANDRVEDKGD